VATVELLLSPLPVHVRTARLVGVAAARRAGLDDDYVADLRLALGEACTRAVALHSEYAPDTPVRIVVRDDPGGLTVEVTDHGPPATPLTADIGDLLGDDDVDPQVALAVLSGLVDDVEITSGEDGTTVALRWPLPPRPV
jgi:anti-sigma regulatory factor (Ser/Thr protein kinase)